MKKARTKGLFLRCLPLYQSQNKVSTAPWNVSAQTLSKYHWSRELSAIPSGTLQGIWFSKYYKVLKIIRFLLLDVLIKTKKYNFLSKKLYFFQKYYVPNVLLWNSILLFPTKKRNLSFFFSLLFSTWTSKILSNAS